MKKAFYTIVSLFSVRRLTKAHNVDVLVVYNLPQYFYTIGISIPVVFDFADDYLAMLRHELKISDSHPVSKIGKIMLEKLVKRSLLVTSVSEILYRQIHHSNTMLLPNGANIPTVNGTTSLLHLDKRKPIIGYVGAFEYFIDLDLMISAAEQLPEFSFLLVGAGREYIRIEEMVAQKQLKNVILTGAVPHHQAMQFITEMDICLNLFLKGPVAHAASPIKLFEYLAHGKPVITTSLVETERLDKEFEVFYYADTLKELTTQIQYIFNNPEETQRRIHRGQEIIQRSYTWSAIARNFLKRIEKTLMGYQ